MENYSIANFEDVRCFAKKYWDIYLQVIVWIVKLITEYIQINLGCSQLLGGEGWVWLAIANTFPKEI